MPLDVQAFATEVAHTITLAITPLLERLTAIETRLAYVGDLRDRVVTLEAKAAIVPPEPEVDLSKILEFLRERLITLEGAVKYLDNVPRVDLTPAMERIATLEAKAAIPSAVPTIDDPTPLLAEMRDRVVSLEAQTAALPRLDLTPAMERVAALEARLNVLGDLRDRVVTMESKSVLLAPPLPGPPGPPGKDGRDGIDGKDGTNGTNGEPGLGFDDLRVEQDGERGVVVKFARGMELKEFPLMFPIVVYRGVFTEGKGYSVGDVVTWAGSAWHCQQDTTDKPEENHRAWRLMVKRGNEGRAGRDGKDLLPPPVVSTGVARAR